MMVSVRSDWSWGAEFQVGKDGWCLVWGGESAGWMMLRVRWLWWGLRCCVSDEVGFTSSIGFEVIIGDKVSNEFQRLIIEGQKRVFRVSPFTLFCRHIAHQWDLIWAWYFISTIYIMSVTLCLNCSSQISTLIYIMSSNSDILSQ